MSRLWTLPFISAFLPLAVACVGHDDSDSDGNDGQPLGEQPLVCHGPSGPMTSVPECGSSTFCVPETLETVLDGSTCKSGSCRFTYAVNAGDTLTYEDEEVFLFMRFDRPIAGVTTTQELKDALSHVNFMREYRGSVKGSESPAVQFESTQDLGRFEIFELDNGILHVRLPFTLATPYLWIQSSAPGCASSDMLGVCVCNYEVPPQRGVVEIELPADIPAG